MAEAAGLPLLTPLLCAPRGAWVTDGEGTAVVAADPVLDGRINGAWTPGQVAAEFAAAEANIINVAMTDDESDHRGAVLRFTIQVRDRRHLARVIRAVRRLPEVVRIERATAATREAPQRA